MRSPLTLESESRSSAEYAEPQTAWKKPFAWLQTCAAHQWSHIANSENWFLPAVRRGFRWSHQFFLVGGQLLSCLSVLYWANRSKVPLLSQVARGVSQYSDNAAEQALLAVQGKRSAPAEFAWDNRQQASQRSFFRFPHLLARAWALVFQHESHQ